MTASDIHNKLAGEIVKAIVQPESDPGWQVSDSLVLLESVMLGVMLYAEQKSGYKEYALDVLVTAVKRRWRDIRLERNGLKPREQSSAPVNQA